MGIIAYQPDVMSRFMIIALLSPVFTFVVDSYSWFFRKILIDFFCSFLTCKFTDTVIREMPLEFCIPRREMNFI